MVYLPGTGLVKVADVDLLEAWSLASMSGGPAALAGDVKVDVLTLGVDHLEMC